MSFGTPVQRSQPVVIQQQPGTTMQSTGSGAGDTSGYVYQQIPQRNQHTTASTGYVPPVGGPATQQGSHGLGMPDWLFAIVAGCMLWGIATFKKKWEQTDLVGLVVPFALAFGAYWCWANLL